VKIQADDHVMTAAEPLPGELRMAVTAIGDAASRS